VTPVEPATGDGLDVGQQAAVAALASDAQLVVVEGAAGAGKTTTLAATREPLTAQHHRLVVVTPTLKAAQTASAELRAHAGSAAWPACQHGWRWNDIGAWRRLRAGELDRITGHVYEGPQLDAQLRDGDLLLVDEAGMLDQDTAHAPFTIADEHAARLALVGDRHQLPAIGRGVLDLAHRWAKPGARVDLDMVYRFTRDSVTDDGTLTRVLARCTRYSPCRCAKGTTQPGVRRPRGAPPARLRQRARAAAGDRRPGRRCSPRGEHARRRGGHPRASRESERGDPRPARHRRRRR
jgi:ATP-dependent exoDNAse (exonuclease V) alpha subunit